jgi:hypothetical protein
MSFVGHSELEYFLCDLNLPSASRVSLAEMENLFMSASPIKP